MKLGLDIKTSLTQTLTPQQIQYLKLLQLPVVQLEQHLKQEIESNPMLEENELDDLEIALPDVSEVEGAEDPIDHTAIDTDSDEYEQKFTDSEDYEINRTKIDDESDPFDFYKMMWQDDSEFKPAKHSSDNDDDETHFQIKAGSSLSQDLLDQIKLMNFTDEQLILAAHLVGNIDDDGYLRREVKDIVDEANSQIAEYNFNIQQQEYLSQTNSQTPKHSNPAQEYALDSSAVAALENAKMLNSGESNNGYNETAKSNSAKNNKPKFYKHLTTDDAEFLLEIIRHLDPPGIGSRTIQECLLAQLDTLQKPNAAQKLAIKILTEAYEPFIKKHYPALMKQLGINENYLREALDVIQRLNPKPGGDDYQNEVNTVIPDFVVDKDEESGELIITVNDGTMPSIRLNKAYEVLKKEAKQKKFNKETKNWIRSKYEDAKFLIQAIRQRKNTMLKVMTAIAYKQKNFYEVGSSGLQPLIYKDIAEATGLDISTVCRIVNGKYVQTRYGTYELKYFFSESLPTNEGVDVSTTVIKQELKDLVDNEPKDKPYSDDKLCLILQAKGYNVARRTVAKYREQQKIPVARLRKGF